MPWKQTGSPAHTDVRLFSSETGGGLEGRIFRVLQNQDAGAVPPPVIFLFEWGWSLSINRDISWLSVSEFCICYPTEVSQEPLTQGTPPIISHMKKWTFSRSSSKSITPEDPRQKLRRQKLSSQLNHKLIMYTGNSFSFSKLCFPSCKNKEAREGGGTRGKSGTRLWSWGRGTHTSPPAGSIWDGNLDSPPWSGPRRGVYPKCLVQHGLDTGSSLALCHKSCYL